MQPFVVLSHARSGSSLLMDTLGQHPHVLNLDELFGDTEEERPPLPRSFQRLNPCSPARYHDGQSGADFLRHILFEATHPPTLGAVGCKLFFNQCCNTPEARTIWPFLHGRHDIHMIRLYRQNLLEAWVSEQTAWLTGQWHVEPARLKAAGVAILEVPPLTVPLDEFAGYARERLGFLRDSALQLQRHRVITLEYRRDLCLGFAEAMREIFRFLSLEDYPVRPRLTKLARRSLRDRVANYDEVIACFANTPLGPYVLDSTEAPEL